MLADLGRRLRFEPDDVGYILPFEEVVEALGRVVRARPRPPDDPARLDRRHRRPHEGVRPRLPPHEPAAAGPLAADRRGPAPRRVVPADLRLPHRRAALRARRPPPRLGRALARPRGHRRLRDRGPDARRPRPRRARLATSRSRATSACSASACRSTAERREQIRLTDPWDYGSLAEGVEAWGFRAMQGHRAFMDRAEVARLWFDEDYKPVDGDARRGRPGRARRDGDRRLHADRRRALPAAAHARLVRRGARAAALRRAARASAARACRRKRRRGKRPPY